jgi:hypothetical protein
VSSTFKLSILMESKKINQLATELAPDLSDLTIIGDPTTGISKKITLSQMASLFTGTVEEYANLAAFPLVGVADTIYIALDTNILYRWNTGTSAYVELSPNIVSSLVFNDANGFDGTINLVGSVATLTITTALTTGSVGFIGASGALLQDNANFFWDDTNNRLGLGTNAPTTALDVFGSGIIGRINGTSTNNAYLGFASAGTNKWSIGNVQSDHRFRIFSEANTSELVSVLQTGEFGIGIANPTTKFHIDGAASALIANLDANVSVAKSISFRSDNSNRINLEVSGTESGSNAGANFFIRRYSDAGALIDTPLTITRSTGAASFSSTITAVGLSKFWDGTQGLNIGAFSAGSGYGAIYNQSVTPSTTNFALASNGLSTIINATNDASIVTNNGNGLVVISTGNVIINNGTTDNGYKLDISGTLRNTTSAYFATTSGSVGIGSTTIYNGGGFGRVLSIYETSTVAISLVTSVKQFQLGIAGTNNDFRIYDFTGSTYRFVINGSTGNVGILTTTPKGRLDVFRAAGDSGTAAIVISNGEGGGGRNWSLNTEVINAGDFAICQSTTNGGTPAPSAGNTKLYISSGGFLKASNNGTFYDSTANYHEIKSTVSDNTMIMWNSSASPNGLFINYTATPNNTGNNFLNFYDSNVGVKRFDVRSNGGISNYQANNVNLSDERTKKDIIPLESYWNKFKAIEIVKFKYKDQTHEDFNIGVIAQQVEKVAPEFVDVDGWDNGKPKIEGQEEIISTEEPLKSIYTADLHHATIKVLQEAMAKIEILEEKVKQLEIK